MILSILICTLPQRAAMFEELHNMLQKQIEGKPVEILLNGEGGTTGAKRNTLLQQAKGEFIAFIDDDDMVHEKYMDLVLNCIQSNPGIDYVGDTRYYHH
ncbi:MAG: glycosyltransferase family 2 protein [Bacteroidetes bacterium]|nr:glycosyltransferase family 2 protein [Bacteroidota bacterium]